ncbi:MAG: NAD(P)H-dependent oxidoreductase [Caldilineaceae bacterium]
MTTIVISCSLHPQSRSYVLAYQAVENLRQLGVEAPLYDLRTHPLPFCDAVAAHKRPEAQEIIEAIRGAQTVLMAVPIYNYDVNAAAKNLLELGLRAWNHKLVGFLCSAGGRASYMSVMGFANSLMLDFRCLIVPRFVYATKDDFGDDRQESMYIQSETILARVAELANTTVRLTKALATIEAG